MVTGLLTSQEAADRLGISDRTLRKLRQEGEIRYIAITDHKILYRPEDCDEFIEGRIRRDVPVAKPQPTFREAATPRGGGGFMAQLAERKAALAAGKKA